MDYSNYDVCQMRLGGIGSIFYLDAMDIIKPLESKDKIVAEKLVKRLQNSLDEICLILSHSMRD